MGAEKSAVPRDTRDRIDELLAKAQDRARGCEKRSLKIANILVGDIGLDKQAEGPKPCGWLSEIAFRLEDILASLGATSDAQMAVLGKLGADKDCTSGVPRDTALTS